MKKLTLTLNEKRFLIIWLGVCCFAFFVNIADIKGDMGNGYFFWRSGYFQDDFYPFTTFYGKEPGHSVLFSDTNVTAPPFNGFFNSFDKPEFLFYSILGLAIIFLPKIWK